MFAQTKVRIAGHRQSCGPFGIRDFKAFQRRRPQCTQVDSIGAWIWREMKSFELADRFSLDQHRAGIVEPQLDHVLVAQAAQEYRRPPVHEALSKPVVQRIGQSIFDGACLFLPVGGISHPARTMRGVGPCPYLCQSSGEGCDIALDIVHGVARPWDPAPSLSHSFGFGGHNGSLVIGPVEG